MLWKGPFSFPLLRLLLPFLFLLVLFLFLRSSFPLPLRKGTLHMDPGFLL